MDQKTLGALRASIAKWEQNVKAESPEQIELGPFNCPLCLLFWGEDCNGCPAKEKTSKCGCDRTPYNKAHNTYDDWISSYGLGASSESVATNKAKWRKAAQAEVDFLKSLLPEGE